MNVLISSGTPVIAGGLKGLEQILQADTQAGIGMADVMGMALAGPGLPWRCGNDLPSSCIDHNFGGSLSSAKRQAR